MSLGRHQSSICTYAPDGVSDKRWLGTVGAVRGLSYGSTMPGGDDQLTATVSVPKLYREPALAPGRIIQVWRGGPVYEGRLDRPAPVTGGWQITAHGAGSYGDDYLAIWGTYTASDILSQAIGRGMRWTAGSVGGGNLTQVSDSGSQTVTQFLNGYTNTVSMTWHVGAPAGQPGQIINVFSVPSTVTRLLITTTPAAPDLVEYINALYVRYQTSPDLATAATYANAWSTLPASITAHGRTENYWDLSPGGKMSSGTATADAAGALARFVSATFSQPFTAISGQYLNAAGSPVDLGSERAGEVVRLILAAGGFGGEISVMWPITFPVGAVTFDDEAQHLTITPYQSKRSDFAGLLGVLAPARPVARKPAPRPRHHTHARRP
jgi:hypothetical protein